MKVSSFVTSISQFNTYKSIMTRMYGREITRRYVVDTKTGELMSCRQFIQKYESKFDRLVTLYNKLR